MFWIRIIDDLMMIRVLYNMKQMKKIELTMKRVYWVYLS